jgi:hypothetical protein
MRNWLLRSDSKKSNSHLLSGPFDALLFLRIVCFAAVVPFLLRLQLRTVERVLVPRRRPSIPDPQTIDTIVAMTDAAANRRFVRKSCLIRGTTLYYFLARAGVDVKLSFGIGQVHDAFTGHCWLVKDGEPYLEKHDPRSAFTVIYCVPNDGAVESTSASAHLLAQ